MNKFLIGLLMILCLLTGVVENSWADIRIYTLTQMEIVDVSGKAKVIPILSIDNKPKKIPIVIAGLGTGHITAQCPIYSLVVETQIYPMETYGEGILTDKAKWYYARHDQGVTIIEIEGDKVKVHNLGMVPYTYVGNLNK